MCVGGGGSILIFFEKLMLPLIALAKSMYLHGFDEKLMSLNTRYFIGLSVPQHYLNIILALILANLIMKII